MKISIFLFLALFQINGMAGEIAGVSVMSNVIKGDSNIYLSFDITNNSKSDIETYKSNLPWGNLYSVTLIACTASHGNDEISRKYYFDDPGPEIFVLKKDSRSSGKIDLSFIFPSLKESLKKDDVLVFWSFILKSTSGDTTDRFGGMVVIPRNSGTNNK